MNIIINVKGGFELKVLVTGGAGFIASHIVDKLVESGYDTVIVDNLSTGNIENVNSKAVFYEIDIIDKDKLKEVFKIEKPDYVIHHAAQIDIQNSIQNPSKDALVNIIGTVNLLECAKEVKIKKFLYASTAAVYGNPDCIPVKTENRVDPLSFYGISKYTPEMYIKVFSNLYGFDYTILRYANVYGVKQCKKGEGGVIAIFIDRYLNDEEIIVYGDGEQTRDFIFVEDIANANINALKFGNNKVYNVSSNKSISINDLICILNQISGKKPKVLYKECREGDIKHSRLENLETISDLHWKENYSLENGLKIVYEYYKTLGEGEFHEKCELGIRGR